MPEHPDASVRLAAARSRADRCAAAARAVLDRPDAADGPPPYPRVAAHAHGLLAVGDGQHVYWEVCGNPEGIPALVVHGGPGSGCRPGNPTAFDPDRYRVVLFDQRGCGRSTPHAADPAVDLVANTTEHLLADMERLRVHLGIDRWLLHGGSWGSTLILAYAERHPERVSGIVITGVTTTRPEEIDWLYRGVARFLPAAWERFRDAVPEPLRGGEGDADGLVAAYARLVGDADPQVRARAVQAWAAWEDAVVSHEVNGKPDAYSDRPPAALIAFVRITTHYFAHRAWLEPDILLREAHRLANIPGVLFHGRLDLGSPLATAHDLARAWPSAELVVVPDSGHTGTPAYQRGVRAALDAFM